MVTPKHGQPETIEDLKARLAEAEKALANMTAERDDQIETAATFQERNGELETNVLQSKKARRGAETRCERLTKIVNEQAEQIKLLTARMGESAIGKSNLLGAASAAALSEVAELPEQPAAKAKKAA